MTEIILLRTKGVHFTFDGKLFIQTNSVAIGSPLGPVPLVILMVELENHLIRNFSEHLISWERYIDYTNRFIKDDSKYNFRLE